MRCGGSVSSGLSTTDGDLWEADCASRRDRPRQVAELGRRLSSNAIASRCPPAPTVQQTNRKAWPGLMDLLAIG